MLAFLLLGVLYGGMKAVEETNWPFRVEERVVTAPLTVSSLSEDERILLEKIRGGEYVEVPLESVFELMVLSGQMTESEFDAFIRRAIDLLSGEDSYYATGNQDAVKVGESWEIFIWRTHSPSVFRRTERGVLDVLEYLSALRTGRADRPRELLGVTATIRGLERFVDINGIPGSGQRTWVGFDLRS